MGDIEAAARALEPAQRGRIHVFIATSPLHREHKLGMSKQQVIDAAVAGVRRARAAVRRRRILRRRRHAHRAGVPGRSDGRGDRGRRADLQRARHRRLHHARRDGRAHRLPAPERARRRARDHQRALPQRPGHGRRQQPGRGRRGRAPGRVHPDRHRRARRQCGAGRSGDGAEDPQRAVSASTPASSPSACIRPRAC